MNLLAPISTIMTSDLITIQPGDTMREVEKIFTQHKIHHLPVLDQGTLVGMISKSDYKLFKRGFSHRATGRNLDRFRMQVWKAADVMTTGLAKLDVNDRINVALEIFLENLFHAILITEDDHLVGLVTTYDVIKKVVDDKSVVNSYFC